MRENPDLLSSSYNYELPAELIASRPAEPRDSSRLMVINKSHKQISHQKFFEIKDYLREGDLLVLNNTRVLPARLYGYKNYEGARVEVFLIRELDKDQWLCLAKPAKRLKINTLIAFEHGLEGKVKEILPGGERVICFNYAKSDNFLEIIRKIGEVPFPPYITLPECTAERYQTIFSRKEGSVAAPTAGLHFTENLLQDLHQHGIKICYITLHVGPGTFQPVKSENILQHSMHSEYYEINEETAQTLNEQKKNHGRILCVGTTVTRVLETVMQNKPIFSQSNGYSDIFIYPGFKFKATDMLLTNFHLPGSTLLMLVSAFWQRQELLKAYQLAIQEKYRFYSLGDAMLII